MNQDINVKLFLELDNFVDFLLNSTNILLLRNSKNSVVIISGNSILKFEENKKH